MRAQSQALEGGCKIGAPGIYHTSLISPQGSSDSLSQPPNWEGTGLTVKEGVSFTLCPVSFVTNCSPSSVPPDCPQVHPACLSVFLISSKNLTALPPGPTCWEHRGFGLAWISSKDFGFIVRTHEWNGFLGNSWKSFRKHWVNVS